MQGCAMYFGQGSAQQIDNKHNTQLLKFNMWKYICTHTLQFFGILYTNSTYESDLQ
jgi:hypothetical protein